MNELSVNKMISRAMHAIVCRSGLLVFALTASAVTAQSPSQQKGGARAQWPTTSPYDDAICAFDKALTKAARDREFRQELIRSSDSAKVAVSRVGNIDVLPKTVMIFYEAEPAPGNGIPGNIMQKVEAEKQRLGFGDSNENVHVFVLPEFQPDDRRSIHRYETYFRGLYDVWSPTRARCDVST